jgi:hypothetical protein
VVSVSFGGDNPEFNVMSLRGGQFGNDWVVKNAQTEACGYRKSKKRDIPFYIGCLFITLSIQ